VPHRAHRRIVPAVWGWMAIAGMGRRCWPLRPSGLQPPVRSRFWDAAVVAAVAGASVEMPRRRNL